MSFETVSPLLSIVLGILLLVAGRKLYWLSVGVLGFLTGIILAARFFPGRPEWMTYVIAGGLGILGAVAAVVLQKIAVAALGFVAGGFLLVNITEGLHWTTTESFWLPFLLGGVLGAILLSQVFDWVLIIASSITGAYLLVKEIHIAHSSQIVVLILLTVIGVLIQSRTRGKKQPHGRRKKQPSPAKRKAEEAKESE
ncbi:MAG: DUF4203 domain-containing protein [Ignavibacteriae bacterium]|nr:DUF4203 domain-containing protein [Ignavibacteria bacterium]MBI3364537.1 DUF4203 domain-containing protein [Ignavibacteriota bacterium]